MENEVEEENKLKKNKLIATTPDWLDLPEPIATNIILEHLDIVDYIQFSVVCKKWLSVQKEHQIRHFPYPPPSPLPFPWLCCFHCFHDYNGDIAIHFYLPDKQKVYNIPLNIIPKRVYPIGYGYGWLLLQLKFNELYHSFCILNPITGVQRELPQLSMRFHAAYISSPPTNPNCNIVLLDCDYNVYQYRLNNNSFIKTNYSINKKDKAFFFHNKLYCMVGYKKICMVDALLPDKIEQMIEMDCSEIQDDRKMFHFVDFLGEVVMVMVVFEELQEFDYDLIKEFILYRADFLTNKWIRIESLGDHALFFSYSSMFSLPSTNVQCKKNTIYLPRGLTGGGVAWRAFDVGTKNWIDGRRMSRPSNKYHFHCRCSWDFPSRCKWNWFLPTLCPALDYNSVSKTNGAC